MEHRTHRILAFASMMVFLAPAAQALDVGVDADHGLGDIKAAGASAEYAQIWAGNWIKKSGWGEFDEGLRKARDAGAIPVVLFYYWGDDISVDGVKYGQNGRTKSDWDAFAGEVARRIKSTMGTRTAIVVLEPEFNKNGISQWESFDGYLENQARIFRSNNPALKIVIGFGHWSNPPIFDRAVAAADYTGFQYMRASTRDSVYSTERTGDKLVEVAKAQKAAWGKPILMYDLAIGTYGGWEGVQEKALRNVIARTSDLEAAGVKGLVWRYTRDNDYSSGYYGAAESSWGVKRRDLSNKPAWDELLTLLKGSTSTSPSEPAPAPAPAPEPGTSVFSDVGGNTWWIETDVAGSPSKVEARVNGGSWKALEKKSWGAWATSMHAPTGSIVELKATFSTGTASASYRWPDATPVTGTQPSPAPTPDASVFSNVKGNEWWIQANVAGSPAKVEARVNGGSWKALEKKSWGAWAVSTHAPTGSTVELKATFSSGTASASYRWPDATPVSGGSTSSFDASFTDVGGNEWWIEVTVRANAPLAGVDARVNGGSWVALELKSWGDWAKSIHAPKGSKVEFRARSTSGASDASASYTWPA